MDFHKTPFTYSEYLTIEEVFEYGGLNSEQLSRAWDEIVRRWRAGSGRFYAYDTAHVVVADILRDAS